MDLAARPAFKILGPLEVCEGDRRLTLGGPKQRALLATLLLNANRTVSMEQLVGVLWADAPVDSAVVQVQGHVSTLRRLLGGGEIVTSRPGYLLRIDAGQLDLTLFERRVGEARGRLRAGDVEAAAGGYRAALQVWRGAALSDIGAPRVRALAAQLDDVRLTVLEERIEADLALGRHRELVAELSELIVRHPFRERLRAQTMLALHRSGRRAKALDVARETRRVFAEEQGLDPSPELQALEHALLVGDPALDLESRPAPPVVSAPPPVPRQLPAGIADFTGRDAELLDVCARVLGQGSARSVTVTVVAGPGGVGKSTLAVHAAHRLAPHFPDGQLYASLRPAEPDSILSGFLGALGAEPSAIPDDGAARAALYRTMVADRRLLVVLDDATESRQVRPLLPGGPGSAVLVTSRAPLGDVEGSRCVELDLLDRERALSLFSSIVGPERAGADLDAAADVVAACGYLPLAIRIAASRLATRGRWTIRALADMLADSRSRLDALEYGELGVRASFEVSYRALEPEPARAFRLLGLLDGPDVGLEVAAAVLEQPVAGAELMLEHLVDARLLDSPGRARYRYHDLTRLFARERAAEEPEAERDAALGRALRFALSSIERVDMLVRPGRLVPYTDPYAGPAELPAFCYRTAVAWLESEHPGLRALVLQGAARPSIPALTTACLAAHLSGFLEVRALWEDWEEVARATLAAALREGDGRAEALAGHELALLARRRGRPAEAAAGWDRCLALFRRAGDRLGEVRARNNLGGIAMDEGRLAEAAEHFQAALALCRENGIRRGECGLLTNLGIVEQMEGRLDAALDLYRESLAIQRETGNRDGEANTLNNIGCCHREQGRYPDAIAFHEQALAICRESGNRFWEAETLIDLALTCRQAGRAEAAAHAETALALGRGMSDRLLEARARELLAGIREPARG